MGMGIAIGVPGVEGPGEETAKELLVDVWFLVPISGGAGLLDDIRLAGRSILMNLPCDVNVNWPSFVFNV
jgi:hypothetical protein